MLHAKKYAYKSANEFGNYYAFKNFPSFINIHYLSLLKEIFYHSEQFLAMRIFVSIFVLFIYFFLELISWLIPISLLNVSS